MNYEIITVGRNVYKVKVKKPVKPYRNIYAILRVCFNVHTERDLINMYNDLKSRFNKTNLTDSTFMKWIIKTLHNCVTNGKCEELGIQATPTEEYTKLKQENEDLKVKVRELEGEVDRLRRENVDLLRKVSELLEEINKNVVVKCESITIGVYRVTICGKGFIVDYLTNMDIIRQKFLTRDEYINFVNLLQRYGLLEAVKIERIR